VTLDLGDANSFLTSSGVHALSGLRNLKVLVLHTDIVRSRDFKLLVDKTALSSVSTFTQTGFLYQGQATCGIFCYSGNEVLGE
jgi:hypothetical protein